MRLLILEMFILESKNLLSDFLSTTFAIISYIILVKSIIDANGSLIFTTSLLYIFPKFIQSIQMISVKIITKAEFVLRVFSIISGALVIIVAFLGLSKVLTYVEYGKPILIVSSAGFVLCDIYLLIRHIKKHNNINNIINKNRGE